MDKPETHAGKSGHGDDLNLTLYAAIKAAKLGREVLLNFFGRLEKIEEKFQAGLVSEADKESERVIKNFLQIQFPQDEFLGEESTDSHTKIQSSTKGRWICDPLDGTTNYIHRFPIFAVNLAYEVKGVVQVAVTDLPMLGEVYTAIRGRGAFVNGRRIHVSATEKLADSFLATGFFGDNEKILQEQLQMFPDMVRNSRAIRRAGAAAYDLCQVARGVFDGYWERNLKPWDSAPGLLLVEEAGGVVTTFRGQPYSPYHNSLIAGNPAVVKLIQENLAPNIFAESD